MNLGSISKLFVHSILLQECIFHVISHERAGSQLNVLLSEPKKSRIKFATTVIVGCCTITRHSFYHPIELPYLPRIDLQLRHSVLNMLARSCLRSTRAFGAVRNGAVKTTKVRSPTTRQHATPTVYLRDWFWSSRMLGLGLWKLIEC